MGVLQGSQSAAHGTALPFAALNGALATDVACVVIPSGVHVHQPLHILYLSTGVLPVYAVQLCFKHCSVCEALSLLCCHISDMGPLAGGLCQGTDLMFKPVCNSVHGVHVACCCHAQASQE